MMIMMMIVMIMMMMLIIIIIIMMWSHLLSGKFCYISVTIVWNYKEISFVSIKEI